MLQIVYFAKVRETLGLEQEPVEIAPGTSVNALIDQMVLRGGSYALAFADRTKLRFALDQNMVRGDSLLDGARELAIFPPVTGG